jgi:hypothetical protein
MKALRTVGLLLDFSAFFSFVPKAQAADPCEQITQPPLLYQIDRSPNQATLYFTPINTDQVISYTFLYGLHAEDERYSLTINQGPTTGAIAAVIQDLTPGVQYSYKASGNTSCVSSPWSAWVGDAPVTEGTQTIIPSSAIPVTGPETIIVLASTAVVMILSGLSLFAYARRKDY